MVSEQKKTRKAVNAAGTIAKGYRNKQKHATKRRKLSSLVDGGA